MNEIGSSIAQYGGWGLFVLVIILFISQPEKVEKWSSMLLNLSSWLNASIRRRAIKTNIQSKINTFSRSIDKEAPGTMPFNMKLEFVKKLDRAEFLLSENTVIVRIRDRKQEDKNLAHAMLSFCPAGLLPSTRPYLDGTMNTALDFTITRKLLGEANHYTALQYLYTDIIEPAVSKNSSLDKICKIFDKFDEQGLFSRVILREFKDFGMKLQGRYPEPPHKQEANGFIDYVNSVATRVPGEQLEAVGYQGVYISMGFVLVGKADKIVSAGATLYLRHIQKLRAIGVERAYIAARGQNIDMAKRVAYLAQRRNLAKSLKPKQYYAADTQGQRREHVLIELQLAPRAPYSPPEQGILIESE